MFDTYKGDIPMEFFRVGAVILFVFQLFSIYLQTFVEIDTLKKKAVLANLSVYGLVLKKTLVQYRHSAHSVEALLLKE